MIEKTSSFGGFHPAVLFFYYISVLSFSMFTVNPIMLFVSTSGGICFLLILEQGKKFINDLRFYLPMFILVSLLNPLFSHNGITPLFFMNGNPVTLEAVLYGVDIALLFLAVIMWCRSYTEIMTEDKFMYLFSKTVPKTALIITMTVRYIPVLKRQMKKISDAQKGMGLYSSKSFTDKLRSGIRVFSALITWSFENSVDTARSMRARGYGLKGRTSYSLFKFTYRDFILFSVSLIFAFITLYGMATKSVYFYFYPGISEFNFNFVSVLTYISFTVLCFIPFIQEIKESLKWKFYISKI